jgi:hypothetical protein
MRFYAMFNDRSEHMVIMPDIQTQAAWLGNTRPGTAQGEFWRFVAQFKTWPTALIQHAIGREIYGSQSRAAALGGILQMAVAATVLGWGIMTLKHLIKDRKPRDPGSGKTWAAALMQGGGAGDFCSANIRAWVSPLLTPLGPVVGQGLSTVVDIWNRLKAGAEEPDKKHDIAPELFRALLDNAPSNPRAAHRAQLPVSVADAGSAQSRQRAPHGAPHRPAAAPDLLAVAVARGRPIIPLDFDPNYLSRAIIGPRFPSTRWTAFTAPSPRYWSGPILAAALLTLRRHQEGFFVDGATQRKTPIGGGLAAVASPNFGTATTTMTAAINERRCSASAQLERSP